MLDTAPEAARELAEAHRRMGHAERFRAACQMSEAFRAVALARIHQQNPGFLPAQCRADLVWQLHGIRLGG